MFFPRWSNPSIPFYCLVAVFLTLFLVVAGPTAMSQPAEWGLIVEPSQPGISASGRSFTLDGSLEGEAELLFGTLIAGTQYDEVTSIDEGPDGTLCFTGSTNSILPGQPHFGGVDVFTGCFAPDTRNLIFLAQMGGNGDDFATGV